MSKKTVEQVYIEEEVFSHSGHEPTESFLEEGIAGVSPSVSLANHYHINSQALALSAQNMAFAQKQNQFEGFSSFLRNVYNILGQTKENINKKRR